MRRLLKIISLLFVLILFTNIPLISTLMCVFFGPIIKQPFGFITKDFKYCQTGSKADSYKYLLRYNAYKKANPNADHTLYRFYPKRDNFRFWLWGQYLFSEDWSTPYIDASHLTNSAICPPGTAWESPNE